MPDSVAIGSEVVLVKAEVLLLTGDTFCTSSSLELGQRLVQAYECKQPNEVPQDPKWIRVGYQHIGLTLQLAGDQEATLVFPQLKHPQWEDIGGPEISGDPYHLYVGFGKAFRCPHLVLPGSNGQELGEFIQRLATEEVVLLISKSSYRGGSLSRDDYVVLSLQPANGVMGRGELHVVRSHAAGLTYDWLYRLEGGDTEAGRGDHVGGYPQSSFGL